VDVIFVKLLVFCIVVVVFVIRVTGMLISSFRGYLFRVDLIDFSEEELCEY